MEISFYLLDLPVIHRVFPIEGNLLQFTFFMVGDVLTYTGIFKCLRQDFNIQAGNFLQTGNYN